MNEQRNLFMQHPADAGVASRAAIAPSTATPRLRSEFCDSALAGTAGLIARTGDVATQHRRPSIE